MSLEDIETFVVVIMENRSFDHMLGYLSLPGPGRMRVEGLRAAGRWRRETANLHESEPYEVREITAQEIDDPPHEKATIALQIETRAAGLPRMGGFVQSYTTRSQAPRDPALVMGYYTAQQVPTFDFFAHQFAVCDHWFSALPTGTQANRFMAMSGESPLVDNAELLLPDRPLVYDWLSEHHQAFCVYQSGDYLPFFSLMPRWLPEIATSLALSHLNRRGRFRRYAKFREDWCGSGPMPPVVFIEPEYTDGPHSSPNDDHSPTGVAAGQAFLADVYATLVANPKRWRSTMMLVFYDEHGGFFDHLDPIEIPTRVAGFEFRSCGVRVPAFVVSPHVRPGTVFRKPLDHTSFLQLLADRFNPGQAYSAAVAARQPQLGRLRDVLVKRAPAAPRRPRLAAPRRTRRLRPAVPRGGITGSPPVNANARAFHRAALQVARDHPDLVRGGAWPALEKYLETTKDLA